MARSIINTSSKDDKKKQAAGTPWEFIAALGERFGTPVDFDLAALKVNAKADSFFSPEDDSLKQDWRDLRTSGGKRVKLAYLNPPYADIDPWAAKLVECRWLKRWTVALWPASFSCRWWNDRLVGKVQIDAIPRMKFIGQKDLYPKDLAIAIAGFGVVGSGFWDWRISLAHARKERLVLLPDLSATPDPFFKGNARP